MRCVITGAAGFIGSALMQALLDQGHDVIGVDNYNTYYNPILKRDRVSYRKHDVIDLDIYDITEQHVSEWQPDVVIHLGARAGVRTSFETPELYHRDNIDATYKLINACEKAGVKKVVYASTSSLMANNTIVPWVESEPLGHVLSPYAYTKYVNECQFRISNIPSTIGLRFFTVYGPWGRPDMALFNFVNSILQGKPIDVYNYGDMKRDFTYIDDIINGIVIAINTPIIGHELFNVGNGNPVNIKDFINCIEAQLGVKAVVKLLPKHPADAKETWADITKISRYGYNPTTDIEQGVSKFIEWYRNYNNKGKL